MEVENKRYSQDFSPSNIKVVEEDISKEDSVLYKTTKRLLDLILSTILLIVSLPVALIIVILIKLEDNGPVFYTHYRVGKDLNYFKMYKFRTMIPDADKKLKEMVEKKQDVKDEFYKYFKLKEDPRVTRIGEFLRKTSLDELPQLINVLKGEMSLVGPRPIVTEELEMYYQEMGKICFSVKPGITGMWQVNGRNDVDYPERIMLDLEYVKKRNLFMDIKILLKTIKTVLTKEGAY